MSCLKPPAPVVVVGAAVVEVAAIVVVAALVVGAATKINFRI